MTLVEAFVFFRIPCNELALAARNDDAGDVLERALNRFGLVRPCSAGNIDDVRQNFMIRFGLKGPRCGADGRPNPGLPDSDKRVLGYLRRSLFYGCISEVRRGARETSGPDADDQGAGDASTSQARERYEALERRVFALYVPRLSVLMAESVDELRRVRSGVVTVDALIDADPTTAGEPRARTRNRRYRRYFNALKHLHRLVEQDSELSDEDRDIAHQVVDDLRIYESRSTRSAVHGGEAQS